MCVSASASIGMGVHSRKEAGRRGWIYRDGMVVGGKAFICFGLASLES